MAESSVLISPEKALGEQKPVCSPVSLEPPHNYSLLQNNGILLTVDEVSAFFREQVDLQLAGRRAGDGLSW